jgi:hypothetical protein
MLLVLLVSRTASHEWIKKFFCGTAPGGVPWDDLMNPYCFSIFYNYIAQDGIDVDIVSCRSHLRK